MTVRPPVIFVFLELFAMPFEVLGGVDFPTPRFPGADPFEVTIPTTPAEPVVVAVNSIEYSWGLVPETSRLHHVPLNSSPLQGAACSTVAPPTTTAPSATSNTDPRSLMWFPPMGAEESPPPGSGRSS